MPKDGDTRSCVHKADDGKPCDGKQTFSRHSKPPGWHTSNVEVQSGWLCDKNREHFDRT